MNSAASTAIKYIGSSAAAVVFAVPETTATKEANWTPSAPNGYGMKLLIFARSNENPTNGVVGNDLRLVKVENICDRVIELDHALNLPRKLLADVLQISRTTLYELLNGASREYRNEDRLKEVEHAASIIHHSTNYPIGRSAILVKINRLSLAETLKANEINFSAVKQFALAIHSIKEKERVSEEDMSSKREQHTLTQFIG